MVVRMPGKMRAARIQVFTRRHEDEEAKLLRKIWEKTSTKRQ